MGKTQAAARRTSAPHRNICTVVLRDPDTGRVSFRFGRKLVACALKPYSNPRVIFLHLVGRDDPNVKPWVARKSEKNDLKNRWAGENDEGERWKPKRLQTPVFNVSAGSRIRTWIRGYIEIRRL